MGQKIKTKPLTLSLFPFYSVIKKILSKVAERKSGDHEEEVEKDRQGQCGID